MKHEIEQVIAGICKKLFNAGVVVVLTRPDEQFGDYATNVALQLSKKVGKNPREVAAAIVAELAEESTMIDSADVAGPGFINLRLTSAALLQLAIQPHEHASTATVVIETNNPNPFKAMHIGHAFNAIIADTIANLLEASSAHLYRVSYHGDVGLHVGKSMYSLLKFIAGDPIRLSSIEPSARNSFMSKMYADGSTAYKQDSAAKAEIDELAKQSFTRTNPVYAAVYDTCKAWSFEQIDEIVARLGNKPIERRFLESDADARGVAIVRKNVPKVFQESDGALVFAGSKYGAFDNAFVTSRGLGLYGARDLGLMQLKNEYYHPDKSYIVTAEEQKDYFKGVIKAAELCMPELAGVTVNIPTGTVKLSTGKMSSRDGDVLEINWLFEQISDAINRRGGNADQAIVAGSLRYQFLKVRVGSDVVFDVDEAVSLQGNSGPYLQYAHARACSVLAKGAADPSSAELTELEAGERSLLRKLGEYPEVLDRAIADLMPHGMCTYLYELAQTFNRFYEHNRVLGDVRESTRLRLVHLYAETLRKGLAVLGIAAPEHM